MSTLPRNDHAADDYLDLVREFSLKSIDDDQSLSAAETFLDELLNRGDLPPGAMDYVEALTDLIAYYEDQTATISNPSDAELLRHLMEAKGVNQAEVVEATGISKSSVSEVLQGKKSFTKKMYGPLAEFFGVGKGVFAGNA